MTDAYQRGLRTGMMAMSWAMSIMATMTQQQWIDVYTTESAAHMAPDVEAMDWDDDEYGDRPPTEIVVMALERLVIGE